MFSLPKDIQTLIYEYDSTYRIQYSKTMQELKKFIKTKQFVLGYTGGFPVTIENYVDYWNRDSCIQNKHTILLTKPYGVLACCVDCNHIQGMVWRH